MRELGEYGFETVGSFVRYRDTLAFMIGPDLSGKKLGITRIGGHIEGKESLLQALNREIMEEAAIEVTQINSPCTFYKANWEDEHYYNVADKIEMDVKPLVIVGDKERATAVFLSCTEEEPRPSAEAYGIIFLGEENIKDICTKKLSLKDFLNDGGKLVQQEELDYGMEIYAGVHLTFLNRLIEDGHAVAHEYMTGKI